MIDFAGDPGFIPSTSASGSSAPAGTTASPAAVPRTPEAVRARRRRLARLGDEIARLSAHIQAAHYRLLEMIRAFDEGQGWYEEGFRSCAEWLSWRIGIGPGAAREKVRVARALGDLPELSAALRTGELSYSVARAITRVATPENEAGLVEAARHSTAADMERLVGAWRVADRAEAAMSGEGERERHAKRELWVVPDGADGSWVIRGRLDPEVGAVLCRALEAAGEALYGRKPAEGDRPSAARRADALGLVAEAALGEGLGAGEVDGAEEVDDAHGATGTPAEEAAAGDPDGASGPAGRRPAPVVGRAERFQVTVHVSAETLSGTKTTHVSAETPSGTGAAHVSAETSSETETPPAPSGEEPAATDADDSASDGARKGGAREDGPGAAPADRLTAGAREGAALPEPPEAPRIEGGPHVSAETARRLACDAGVVEMTHDREGNVLDVGRRRRTVPMALRRTLEHRDGGCRFPGCRARFCDAPHIVHWARGGETKLENLVLLCSHHHRRVHEDGWTVEWVTRAGSGVGDRASANGDGGARHGDEGGPELVFRRPDGRELPRVPSPPALPPDPPGELQRAQRGLGIDAWTTTPAWEGERMDIDWALFTLST